MVRGKWVIVIVAVCLVAVGTSNGMFAYWPVHQTLKEDPRNDGVSVWVHYQYCLDPRHLVLDLRGIDGTVSKLDVFRVLLQCAHAHRKRTYESVILAYRGRAKFVVPGDYFRTLGEEYEWQNPVYTARTFPYHIRGTDGNPVFRQPVGGWLWAVGVELDDFHEFHDRWYFSEMVNRERRRTDGGREEREE